MMKLLCEGLDQTALEVIWEVIQPQEGSKLLFESNFERPPRGLLEGSNPLINPFSPHRISLLPSPQREDAQGQ